MTKFYIQRNPYSAEIESANVVKETTHMITYERVSHDGRISKNTSKKDSYYEWHDTWESARDALLEKAKGQLAAAIDSVDDAHKFVGSVKKMKKTDTPP